MSKVLVVEDEAEVRELISSTLSIKGFDIVEAMDAEAGLEAFKEHKPNIVLTDINMPGSNGLWLIDAIRKIDTVTPIIVISGLPEVREKTLKMRVNAFLLKPFKAASLVVTVNRVST